MNNATVLITEKPSILGRMAPVLTERWDTPIYAITTYYLGLYEFRYPRGLRISDYPVIKEPMWKPRSITNSPAWRIQEGEVTPCTTNPETLLQNASTIIFACDPDHSGAAAFNILIEQSLGTLPTETAWPAMHLLATNEAAISQSIEAMGTTSDEWFRTISNAGQAKRFFDFNFNANALALLSPKMRKAGCPDKQSKVSKYGLQMLYSLRDEEASDTSSLIARMENWKGTGRYQAMRLGTSVSMSGIIDNLINSQLVEADAAPWPVPGAGADCNNWGL